jgi:hypothetical protein
MVEGLIDNAIALQRTSYINMTLFRLRQYVNGDRYSIAHVGLSHNSSYAYKIKLCEFLHLLLIFSLRSTISILRFTSHI